MSNLSSASMPVKKRSLLEAALSHMIAKGYHGTTVDEICVAAGVTKGSFFHYFKSKEDIGGAAADYYALLQQALLDNARLDQYADPLARLHAYLDVFARLGDDSGPPQGCLLSVMVLELADGSDKLRLLCREKLADSIKPLERIIDEIKMKHPGRLPMETRPLSEFFYSAYLGSLVMAKAANDRTVIAANIEHFRKYMVNLLIR